MERGIKGSNAQHQNVKELKKTTKYYENKVNNLNRKLDNAINDFENKMETTRNILFDKEYVKVKKDTFDSMNKVIVESQQIMEFQPKIEQLFNEVDNFTKSHQTLEKQNKNMEREIKTLTTRNQNLAKENNRLTSCLEIIIEMLKNFFRILLQIGNNKTKELTANEIKNYYDNNNLNNEDIYDIANKTDKEDELFDYANLPDYFKSTKKSYNRDKSDDFDMTR